MTTTPILTGRDIGQTENALRALLDRILDGIDLTYPQWTVLFGLDAAGTPVPREQLVARQVAGLHVPEGEAAATVDGLVEAGLLAPAAPSAGGAGLVLTARAEAVFRPARRSVAQLTDELYGDIPVADLEATHRTLAEVTRRANARLAS